jgi:hypothetical protein
MVACNLQSEFIRVRGDTVVNINLDPGSLANTHPELSMAIGRGRIVSHALQYWGPGLLVTFIVEDD